MAEVLQGMEQLEVFVAGLVADVLERDFAPILGDFIFDLQNAHEEYFATGTGPSGSWPPLAPSTIAKKGHATILVDTGALRDSLTGPHQNSIRSINKVGDSTFLAFGTLDEKHLFHQLGLGNNPERVHLGMTEDLADKVTEKIADDIVRGLL